MLFSALNGSFDISTTASPGNLRELTFVLASSNILSNLSCSVLLNLKVQVFLHSFEFLILIIIHP